ncbi:MAG: glycosyltransferase [Candidatus Acidiferrales bacterium]
MPLPTADVCRSSSRSKVVIGHPIIGRAGSESNVMWLIEALKRDCDVTVLTTGGWNLAELNEFYGTQVREDEVKVRIAPVPLLPRNVSAAALRGACYQRFALQIAGEYDVRISAYNATDWGLPAIHFIADFCWHRTLREKHDPPTPGFIYRDSVLRRSYLRIAKACGRSSGRDVLRDDVVIANSRWTAERLREYCGVDCAAVVYHPVWTEFPDVPWEEKAQAFVMIGRIAPEKRVERAIAIVDAVRRRGYALRFHLCGQIGDDIYGRRIAHLCREHADWITVEGQVTGKRKAQMLAGCRFGIQAREAEPFGISVAEMVKAGAIVFAPNDGGQAEILDVPDLLFADEAEAVEKVQAVLEQPKLLACMRTHLANRAEAFGAQRFMRGARACTTHARWLAAKPSAPHDSALTHRNLLGGSHDEL